MSDGELLYVPQDQFLIWFKLEVAKLRKKIYTHSQEELKEEINEFFGFYLSRLDEKSLRNEINLSFYELLNEYAYYFKSVQTFENMRTRFKDKEINQDLLVKFPVRFKLIYSVSILAYFNLLRAETKDPKNLARKDFIEPALQGKYYLTSLYNEYLSNPKLLSKPQLIKVLNTLGSYLGMFSRWYEGLYFLRKAEILDREDPNTISMKAGILDAIEEKTCSNYGSLLLLETIDSCKWVYNSNRILEKDKIIFREIAKSKRKVLRDQKQSITELRKHKNLHLTEFLDYSNYEKFCFEKDLYLTEHSIYCSCKMSTRDDITIKSGHSHTHINYVDPFEDTLNTVRFDFVLARQNYFNSIPSSKLTGFNTRNIGVQNKVRDLKIAMLKDSFRLCYSILDTIGIAILDALEIDYNKILKEKFPGQNKHIHFTNLWELGLIETKHFETNYYLQTLYSIAYEVMTKKYSGLKKYREVRNAMEHRIFRISESKKVNKKNASVYWMQREELEEMTQLLLVYTKSLIFTYVNFVRKVTVYKDPDYLRKYGHANSLENHG